MKTDRRDARRLAGLLRAGALTPIAVPSREQEAVRDLCRTRGDMVEDLTRARNRLTKFLLRHALVYRGGSNWTFAHQRWLASLHFEDRALAATFAHYRATVSLRDTSLAAVEADLAPYCDAQPFGDQVHRLAAYRGVTRMGGLCLAAEVFDWRRFPKARPFMAFTGLTASEDSTGGTAIEAGSPGPATPICGPNCASLPGPICTVPRWAWRSESVRPAWLPRPWLAPGAPNSASRPAFAP